MMKLDSIVVAVDFSDHSEVAVAQAMEIARHAGATLTLLHVGAIPDPPAGIPEAMTSTMERYRKILDERLAADRRQLAALRERLEGQGVEISHVLIDGFADNGICRAGEELDADLIVLGSHGRTGFKRFLLGSIAERVVRLSERSVLVARKPDGEPTGGFHRIVVGTDFSPYSERALESALKVAAKGATIDVVHCWHLPPLSSIAYAPTRTADKLVEPIRESMTSAARDRGNALLEQYRTPDVTITFHALEAFPNRGLYEFVDEGDHDLVVTGSHGRRGFRRFVLGSVAEQTVRHAPCSVLVVHGPADEEE